MVSENLESRISKVEAIGEIKNLQAKYCYLIDTRQIEKVGDLFADQFVAEYVGVGTYTTKAALSEHLNDVTTSCSMLYHQIMNSYVEVDGDKATGAWYLFGPFTRITPSGDIPFWTQGKYENEFIKVDGKWKLSHLKFERNMRSPYEDGWVKTRILNWQMQ